MHGLGRHRNVVDSLGRGSRFQNAQHGWRRRYVRGGRRATSVFVQISDSHIGFNKPANTDVVGTLKQAIAKINALPKAPDFIFAHR